MQVIRPLLQSDIPTVLEMDKACFSDPWTDEMWRGELAREDVRCLVIEDKEKLVGFIVGSVLFEDAELPKIAVLPQAQNCGLGTKLLDALCQQLKALGATRMFLEVRVSNLPARQLYKRNGFEILRTRQCYYPDGEDALELKKDL